MSKRKAEAGDMQGSLPDRKATFARHLKALNEQFSAWVKEQAAGCPLELWTDGVEDYLTYAKQLAEDFKDVVAAQQAGVDAFQQQQQTQQAQQTQQQEEEEAPAAKKPAAPGGFFSFSAAPVAAADKPPLGKPPLGGALFGGASSAAAGAGASSAATAPLSLAPLPSTGGALGLGSAPAFGGFGTSGAGSAPAFGFGAPAGGSGLFNVPSTGTLGGSTAADDDDEGEEEEQPAEPSVQIEAAEGVEILGKQRVKLNVLEDKKWNDRGEGTLTLRRAAGEENAAKAPYLVFTTDAGRVLVNAPLIKGVSKPVINPKTPKNLIMMLISVVDGTETRGMHLFKCESNDARKELEGLVLEHTPK